MEENDDSLYRRHEDGTWRDRVNGRIAALTEGENIQNDRLDDLEKKIDDILEVLQGNKNDSGIEGDVRDLRRMINELRAVMLPDSLGHGGVIARLRRLEDDREGKTRTLETLLKFWGPVIIAIISSCALLIREWPDILARWRSNMAIVEAPDLTKKKGHHKKVHRVIEESDDHAEMPE